MCVCVCVLCCVRKKNSCVLLVNRYICGGIQAVGCVCWSGGVYCALVWCDVSCVSDMYIYFTTYKKII